MIGGPGRKRDMGLVAGLGLSTPCLFSAQVFNYQKFKPETQHLNVIVSFRKMAGKKLLLPGLLVTVLDYRDETRSVCQRKITYVTL